MKKIGLLSGTKSLSITLLGLLALFGLLALSACGSNSARVYDHAGVLNVSKVQSAASDLSHPIAIYTTKNFQGTQDDFRRETLHKLNGNPNMVVMAIDTNHRYLYIARGSNVPLSGADINQAVKSFSSHFNNGDYTSASVAALNSLHKSSKSSSRTDEGPGGVLAIGPSLACCIIPVLIVLGLLFFVAWRRGRMGGMGFRRSPFGRRYPADHGPYDVPREDPSYGPQYYGPPNQEPSYGPRGQEPYYGPPNQEPYYGPRTYERGGMNPWVAGGLGAAAGGLAGYGLGRMQDERAGQREDERGGGENAGEGDSFGGGGNFGGGSDLGGGDDFGGGGNFGGGGDDFGQGNDGGGNF